MLNGVHYFFDIDIKASMRDIFTDKPEIDITVDSKGKSLAPVPEIETEKQVFHVPGNIYIL